MTSQTRAVVIGTEAYEAGAFAYESNLGAGDTAAVACAIDAAVEVACQPLLADLELGREGFENDQAEIARLKARVAMLEVADVREPLLAFLRPWSLHIEGDSTTYGQFINSLLTAIGVSPDEVYTHVPSPSRPPGVTQVEIDERLGVIAPATAEAFVRLADKIDAFLTWCARPGTDVVDTAYRVAQYEADLFHQTLPRWPGSDTAMGNLEQLQFMSQYLRHLAEPVSTNGRS